jgi:hypothetical protein
VIWIRPKQVLASLAFGLALFICVWVSRVFFARNVLGPLIPLTGSAKVACIAICQGAIPALPLGFGYGLMPRRNLLAGAVAVAVLGCALELATSSVSIAWWNFKTWWVLPLECLTVLVVFVVAAMAGSRSLQGVRPKARFCFGAGIFALIVVGALIWPWLFSCLFLNDCRLVP